MKTQSGPIKLAILTALAVVAAITLRGVAQSTPTPTPTYCDESDPPQGQTTFVLKIKPRHPLKDDTEATKVAFRNLLNNGHYTARGNKMHLKPSAAGKPEECLPSSGGTSTKIDIQTDKVTTSEMAKNIDAEELTLIQPHVTIQIASPSSTDINAVLLLLAP
jgi:hypothetical protein